MTITATATGTPIPKPDGGITIVDQATGQYDMRFLQMLFAWHNFIVGMNRSTPCNASGTNVITLTPLTAHPLIEKYVAFEQYGFVAANTSTGAVTATVVPKKGTLSTLKVYKTDGAAQAGSGDVVAGSFYWAVYVDSLDAGAGGLVLK